MKYVLYHSSCYDGFGSAFSAWKKLGDTATYIPVSYGFAVPLLVDAEIVYIVDFSYDAEELLKLAEMTKVVVLDHHKTAQEKLAQISHPNIEITFDMEKSGALLTWEYFHPGVAAPMLIQYISDRDLWQFKLPNTKLVHKALVSYPMDFELWDKFDTNTLVIEGETCDRLYSQLVENIIKHPWMKEIGGHVVPIVNTSIAWSEIGHALIEKYPEAKFVASFTVFENQIMWSLRSKEFDVSEVAKKFGGGGHKNAAGFKAQLF